MIRKILMFVVAVAGFVILRGLLRMSRREDGGGRGLKTRLVRDRVCNTYIPQNRALSVRSKSGSGEVHWFCSQECRARWLAGDPGGGAAALVS